MKASAGGFISRRSPETEKQHRNSVILCSSSQLNVLMNVDAHNIFSSSDTTSITPAQYEVISFLVIYIHFSWMLHFLPVVGLIECLQWTLQVTVEFVLSSISLISVSARAWKISDINPCIAVAFPTSWIGTTFIKLSCVCLCVYMLFLKQRMKPKIMGCPIFFSFLARVLCIKTLGLGRAVANEPAMKMYRGLLLHFLRMKRHMSKQTTSQLRCS